MFSIPPPNAPTPEDGSGLHIQGPVSVLTQLPPKGPQFALHWAGSQSHPHSTVSQYIPGKAHMAWHIGTLQPPVDDEELDEDEELDDDDDDPVVIEPVPVEPEGMHSQRSLTHVPAMFCPAQKLAHAGALH